MDDEPVVIAQKLMNVCKGWLLEPGDNDRLLVDRADAALSESRSNDSAIARRVMPVSATASLASITMIVPAFESYV